MADQKISQLTNYTTPLNADLTVIVDTANTTTKKTTWQNIKATLKTYFDTLYIGSNQTITLSGDVSGSGATSITTAIGSGKVTEAMQVLADNTTQDVSTSKHGFAPKAPNDATKYLDGLGNYSVPSVAGITALTLIPLSVVGNNRDHIEISVNVNTTMFISQIIIPFKIIANKISFTTSFTTTAGTLDLTLYSEDGQTQIFSVTTGTIAISGGNVLITTALSAVVIASGIYWLAVNSNSTTDTKLLFYSVNAQLQGATGIANAVTSEPILDGTLTISAGTPPATITPTSITTVQSSALVFRLDN